MDPLPMPETLEDSYEFECTMCSYSQRAAPSIFMTMGVNSGMGRCLQCDEPHHLEIDVEENRMLATPRGEYVEMMQASQ